MTQADQQDFDAGLQRLARSAARAEAVVAAAEKFFASPYSEARQLEALQLGAVVAAADLMTRKTAAAHWQCSEDSIGLAIKAGVLTRYARGQTPMVSKAEGDAAILGGNWNLHKLEAAQLERAA